MAIFVLAACSPTASPTPPSPTLPPRPVSIAADRIPPCTMLEADQADQLGLRHPTPGQGIVEGVQSPSCTWLGGDGGTNVQFIPVGAEVALNLPGATTTQVNGFGAVRNVPNLPGSPPICQLAIDVAPGQTVRVQANAIPNPPYGMDELCHRADEAASMVMTTVVANVPT
ncbi:DUF3558 family protein [Pseudonocardia endophytica]|uniref:DUF3558 family protein n=1 Tax=Pseudonocardia endophytica TaxID=401976 RepID=UPI0014054D21|nr:DUF3558 family protein [Pseudonocardia endophytica]